MDSSSAPTKPSRLVRTQTPIPTSFLSSHTIEDAIKAQTASNTLINRNMLHLHTPLFQDLATDQDNDDEEEEDEEEEEEEEEDEDEKQDGRSYDNTLLDLNKPTSPSATSFASLDSTSNPTFALQADKKSKRIRVDPHASAISSGKRVRFDESKNVIHVHSCTSSISPPVARSQNPTRPLIPALTRSSSQTSTSFSTSFNTSFGASSSIAGFGQTLGSVSPQKFSLSLENTSQDVLDFTSSLTRLMGGAGSQDSDTMSFSQASGSPHFGQQQQHSSPLRTTSMFQASPPSPVRPSFMSYSPPPSSSLSSCWSPSLDDDDEDVTMSTRPLSPQRPVARASQAPKFTPRRPRFAPNASPSRMQPSNAGTKPRFPVMLKREASNASFLDSYPASLAPEPSSPPRLASPSRDNSPNSVAQTINQQSASEVAAFVLNMPLLTKSMSDLSAETSSVETMGRSLKRSSSFEIKQNASRKQTLTLAPLFPHQPKTTVSFFATSPDSQIL
ncbi:hypothetical protein BGZ50_006019 [Haplosporangium sp. Z 11]|nr:hypothetical protein BGZ50_006019 [Haplosporangium sp. Z 11]